MSTATISNNALLYVINSSMLTSVSNQSVIRVLLISDIHDTTDNYNALRAQASFKYDLVIIPGDFLNLSLDQTLGELTRFIQGR